MSILIDLLREAVSTVAQPPAANAKRISPSARPNQPVAATKVLTAAGPNSGTWTATVIVGVTPDGRGWSPNTKTFSISNATPIVTLALETSCDNWGAWITAYTGDASSTGSNGYKGVNLTLEA